VVSSAFEAEYAALFLNGRTAEELQGPRMAPGGYPDHV
jgi:hypothetical protein